MELICANEEVINKFKDRNTLLDATISKFELYEEDSLVCINVWFSMRPSSDFERVMLKFIECKEYRFSYTDDHIFYNVETIKLFQSANGEFYASFDPVNELNKIGDDDQDVILSKSLQAYKI